MNPGVPTTGTTPNATSSSEKLVQVLDLGITDYDKSYSLQQDYVKQKKHNPADVDYMMLVEHPDVYTFGRKSKARNTDELSNVFFIERGGDVTFHTVGQLVCYPILSLSEEERDLHLHLRRLEWTVIDLLAEFGIEGERRDQATGVWIKGCERKIASIGVAVSSWITYHGCALNVVNSLKGFEKINPCGFSSRVMTSMKEELRGRAPSMLEVKEAFLRHFCDNFSRKVTV